MNILKPIEFCTLNGQIMWYGNYIPIKAAKNKLYKLNKKRKERDNEERKKEGKKAGRKEGGKERGRTKHK
jgi:hypothetical protein